MPVSAFCKDPRGRGREPSATGRLGYRADISPRPAALISPYDGELTPGFGIIPVSE